MKTVPTPTPPSSAEIEQLLQQVERLVHQLGIEPVRRCLQLVHLVKDVREESILALDHATFAAAERLGGLLWFEIPIRRSGRGSTEIGYATRRVPREIDLQALA